jgi:uncharacterized protein (TIGR00251 family)
MNERIVQATKDGAILTVLVQPKASRTECIGMHGDALKIRVAAPPVDGAANEEVTRFLAKALAIPRSAVHIESGTSSRHKRIRVTGLAPHLIWSRLM